MTNLALKVKTHDIKHTCYISYSWPVTEAEKGIVQTTLQLVRDLQRIGVQVRCDLTWNSGDQPLLEWLYHHLKISTSLLVVSSPSYLTRAAQEDTLTSREFAHVLAALGNPTETSQPVFYTIGQGSSSTSVHPKFSKILFANISEFVRYYQFLPGLVCRMLQLDTDFEVKNWLTNYTTACGDIIQKVEEQGLFTFEEKIAVQRQVDQIRQSLSLEANLRYSTVLETLTQKDQLFIDGSYSHDLKIIGEIQNRQREALQEGLKRDFPPQKEDLISDITVDNSSSKIFDIFNGFLEKKATVLLLQAPHKAGKTTICRLFADFAYQKKPEFYPVLVDLTTVENPTHRLVEKVLEQQGFTRSMVERVRKCYTLFLLIEGFEKIAEKTNLFVRNQLDNWKCKVVFTCNSQYLKDAKQAAYYFMPGTSQKPFWDGLQILSFTSQFAKIHEIPTEISLPPLSQVVSRSKPAQITKLDIKKLWKKAIQGVLQVIRKKKVLDRAKKFIHILNLHHNTALKEQGYKLMALHFIQPHLDSILQQTKFLASTLPNLHTQKPTTAFISYAWPAQETSQISLQSRLVCLVDDVSKAGITVLLDILNLKPTMDINQFMSESLRTSQVVFLIGTPRLKDRLLFQEDKNNPLEKIPSNNATIEFDHISNHLKNCTDFSVVPLWMDGTSLATALPSSTLHPSPELQHDFISTAHDLRQESQYYHNLPKIVAQLLGVAQTPEFQTIYSNYIQIVKQQEQHNMTTEVLQEKLKTLRKDQEDKIKSLLENISQQKRGVLAGLEGAQLQVLNTTLMVWHQKVVKDKGTPSDSLRHYVPLRGGVVVESSEEKTFDMLQHTLQFLQDPQQDLLFIQGVPGSGKSIFSHNVERTLWEQPQGEWLPLVINLTQVENLNSNFVERALKSHEITPSCLAMLKSNQSPKRLLVILDGLDEVRLDQLPNQHFYHINNLHTFPGSKMIISCRSAFLPTLEKQIAMSYRIYLGLSNPKTGLAVRWSEVILQPFNNHQVSLYVKDYVKTEESEWTAEKYIEKLSPPSVRVLAQTPFVLTLLVRVLPRLEVLGHDLILPAHIYKAFGDQWFEKELWKQITRENLTLSQDWLKFFNFLAEELSVKLVQEGSTETREVGLVQNQEWLGWLPVQRSQGMVRFIHKSMQEYFAARNMWDVLVRNDVLKPEDSLWGLSRGSDESVQALLRAEAAICNFLVDFWRSSHFQQQQQIKLKLFSVLDVSRTQKNYVPLASNAITMLVRCGVSFYKQNLQGVSIQGADLSEGNFEEVDLHFADLTGVRLYNANLRDADLTNSVMGGVSFGELPCWQLKGHASDLAISPDKAWLVASLAGYLAVKNLQTNAVTTLVTGSNWERCLVCSSENILAFLAGDKEIQVWDIKTGKMIKNLLKNDVIELAWCPDGKLVFGCRDNKIYLWDYKNNDSEDEFWEWEYNYPGTIVWSPNGKYIALGNMYNIVCISADLSQPPTKPQDQKNEGILDLIWISEDEYVVLTMKTLTRWKVNEPVFIDQIQIIDCTCMAVGSDGVLAIGDRGGSVQIFSLSTKLFSVVERGNEEIKGVNWNNKGEIVFATGNKVHTRSVIPKETQQHFRHSSLITAMAVHHDTHRVATGSIDMIYIWDIKTGNVTPVIGGIEYGKSLSWDNSGKFLATSGHQDIPWVTVMTLSADNTLENKTKYFYEGKTDYGNASDVSFGSDGWLSFIHNLHGYKGYTECTGCAVNLFEKETKSTVICRSLEAWSWDHEKKMVASISRNFEIWNSKTRSVEFSIDIPSSSDNMFYSVVWGVDGKVAFVGNARDKIYIFDTKTKGFISTIPINYNSTFPILNWSSNKGFLTLLLSYRLIIWNIHETMNFQDPLPPPQFLSSAGQTHQIKWLADFELAHISSDGVASVWDVSKNPAETLANLPQGTPIAIMDIHKDDKEGVDYVITGNRDHSVKIWRRASINTWQLLFSSHSAFVPDGCKLDGVVGMPEESLDFLKQHNIFVKNLRLRQVDRPGWDLVHIASASNDLTQFKNHLHSLDKPTPSGEYAIHLAAAHGALSIIEFLIESQGFQALFTLNKRGQIAGFVANEWGQTDLLEILPYNNPDLPRTLPIHWAAKMDKLDLISKLIDFNPSWIDVPDQGGETPLSIACIDGGLRTKWGFLLGKTDELESGQFSAPNYGRENLFKNLVEKGADLNVKINGESVLFYAVYAGNIEIVKYLLDKGLNPNEKGREGSVPLLWASRGNHFDMVQLLLDRGALINERDDEGKTVLGNIWGHHPQSTYVYKWLVEKGAQL